MTTILRRPPILLPALALVLAGCAGAQATWTFAPVASPTPGPSGAPSSAPSAAPSSGPSSAPTMSPSMHPSAHPSAEPSGAPSSAPSAGPTGAPSGPPSGSPGAARVIDLDETGQLQIQMNGAQVKEIPVTPGETIHFRITNTAGFDHDFYIGTNDQLQGGQATGLPGVPVASSGTQEFDWVVPADATTLHFGCTVPGHYQLMNGAFVAQP